MCGIAGIAGPRKERREGVAAMTQAIAHRGRDGDGIWEDEHVTLGHRRLAVIDLSPSAAQPMVSSEGDLVIVYNGEVYDFAHHRRELERRGVTFRTRSDTEVLLELYRAHGPGFAAKLEGMFAFALWDRRERRLMLARDRFGQKPLYTARVGGAFAFASEIGALRALREVSAEIDVAAVDDLLTLQFIPAPRTAFAAIRRVPRATIVVWTPHSEPVERPLEVPPRPERRPRPFEESVDAADAALGAAVRRTLVADVPVGIFLSGGVDSSLVASYVAEAQRGTSVFTATFPGPNDELPFARKVAERLGLDLNVVEVRPSDYADPAKLVDLFDEPFADVAAIPTALLAARARSKVAVVLGGDGGDEVFGGYAHHVLARWASAAGPITRSAAGQAVRRASQALLARTRRPAENHRIQRLTRRLLELAAAEDVTAASAGLRGALEPALRARLYRPDFIARLEGRDAREALGVADGAGDGVAALFDPDRDAVLPDLFLRKTDVATMSATLEARAPLLDREVVELGRSLPLDHLVAGRRGKRVLRALLARRLGPELAGRRKTGFSPPVSEWLRGELAATFRDTVLAPDGRVAAFVEPTAVAELYAEHLSRRADHRRILWSLLLLELWQRKLQ